MLSTNVLCIKKRKKRSYCIAGGGKTEYGSTSASLAAEKCKRTTGGVNMFHVTENTPPDMLAGAMDLTVHLPNKRSVKMSVERSTPMMDLLVQITTNNHLQLSEYTLEALSMMPSSDHNDSILPFKPNTPIGALDTQHVRVMPKNRTVQVPRNIPVGHQPFESTFRLKVYLPRNQLYVTRVSQSVLLEDIMKKVCEEKNLDPFKYEFRHPGNLDEVLDPKLTLSDYKITEIHVVVKGTGSLNQIFSSSDILALKKEEERKQFHNKTGGGVFNLIFKRGTKQSSGSVSSENRSISPTHSDDSRSVTPPGVQQEIIAPAPAMDRPKPPQRKRRPAPKPPQLDEKPPESKKNENGLTICHSRNSSDSSGYHEASILSDNCNTSLPRRPKSTILPEDGHKLSGEYSQSTSNLSKMSSQSKSTSSLAFPNRKKKSAPPPPPLPVLQSTTLSETETPHEEPSPVVVASQPPVIAQPSESTVSVRLDCPQTPDVLVPAPTINTPPPSSPEKEKIDIIPPPEIPKPAAEDNELEIDWHYKLPDAPQGFRDTSPIPAAVNSADVVDSVVTSPELFEKLNGIKDNQSEKETFSDITSIVSEEDKPILNTLSLENLEKRKSLVYNRELATSLKLAEEVVKSTRHSASKEETFTSSLTKFEKTYNEIKSSSPKQSVAVAPSKSTLPNFKITTYDNPKQKINIFEDDTIRSNNNSTVVNRNSLIDMKPESNLQKNYLGKSMENISFRKNSLEDENKKQYRYFRPPLPTTKTLHVSRSGSFSTDQTWTPSKPVMRSKSQVALNKYRDNNKSVTLLNQDNLTKSNSLFDVSGLQSLGVMRLIQNKLNTPSNSTEALDVEHEEEKEVSYQEPPEIKREVQNFEEKPKTAYQYHTPSINMGTWSERPKVPVNVKEDPDYKFSVKERTNSKLIVNTTNNDIKSHNSIEVRSAKPVLQASSYDRNVTIKVNGSEPISAQNTGNVVIKIGESVNDKPILRKPLGNINKIETRPVSARPHSIAFGGGLDISRVPIVRSVELKKPYKDLQSTNNNNNTSYTQIYQNNNGYNSLTLNRNSTYFTSNNNNNNNNNSENPSLGGLYRSTETLAKPAPPTEPKPVVRVKSFVQSSPTVRGFKPSSNNNSTELNNRQSWNQPFNYSTISNNRDYSTNKSVPFSQSNLRRTESNKNDFKTILPQKVVSQPPPPPAPSMPKLSKVTPPQPKNNFNSSNGGDSKEQLLQAIRDFGGKKGLRAVKA